MLWLTRRGVWLYRVCHDPRGKLLKRIAGAFLLPLVVGYKLLLEAFIKLQLLAIERLHFVHFGLRLKDCSPQFNPKRVPFSLIACVKECLCYVGYMAETGSKSGKF